ncbi:MAG: hypothetical protein JO131_02855 [Gammaproteobacteria bacterium]|nr:hypothetical protein [Gammaproteobacteria bacterium]
MSLDTHVSVSGSSFKVKGNFSLCTHNLLKIKLSSGANFIHSLDALNISILILSFEKSILPIHDCAITSVKNTSELVAT